MNEPAKLDLINNYTMGSGRYEFNGRKLTMCGRAATYLYWNYDDEPGQENMYSAGVSWFGTEIREGRAIPIDGTET